MCSSLYEMQNKNAEHLIHFGTAFLTLIHGIDKGLDTLNEK